jgi:D-lactate dehydrogenase (cytochrome)
MASHAARLRPPRGPRRLPAVVHDPDVVAGVLDDAAHFPGGHAAGVTVPRTEGEIAAVLASGAAVLPIGAQSSLTGGATPRGELVVATTRLDTLQVEGGSVRVGAGVTLDALQAALAARSLAYPAVPTHTGATVGGVVATNAAGPATFKYGTTREWVIGLTVVLPGGDVLELDRGETAAHPDGYFDLIPAAGGAAIRVPVAPVRRPDVPKCSAGYALAAGMDLVDLFIGAEGTLGIVTEARLRVQREPPATCLALVPAPEAGSGLALAAALREETRRTWRTGDPRGLDVAAIEHVDARSVALLREDGADRAHEVAIPDDAAMLLFVAIDLPHGTTREAAWRALEAAGEPGGPDTPLARFCTLLRRHGLLDRTEVVLPGDARRAARLAALREAVPLAVNRRIALARQQLSSAIYKTAGDFIVPFPAFGAMVEACTRACEARGLDLAIWGHLSDGNIHPNVLPRRAEDGRLGEEALFEAGLEVMRLGGSPLAEHGVGRHPVKKRLLARLVGEAGLQAMRAVKHALDPAGRLAPGVLL